MIFYVQTKAHRGRTGCTKKRGVLYFERKKKEAFFISNKTSRGGRKVVTKRKTIKKGVFFGRGHRGRTSFTIKQKTKTKRRFCFRTKAPGANVSYEKQAATKMRFRSDKTKMPFLSDKAPGRVIL